MARDSEKDAGTSGRDGRDGTGRNGTKRLPINWSALLSLFLGTVGVAYVLQFFPGALLLGVIGGFLAERGLRFANERPGHPGRALAWWGIIICAVTFAFSLAIAFQAHFVLTDADQLRATLERVEASEPS